MFSWLGKKQKPSAATTPEATTGAAAATAASTTAASRTAASRTGAAAAGVSAGAEAVPGAAADAAAATLATDAFTEPEGSFAEPGGLNVDALLAPPAAAASSGQPEIGPTDEALTEALEPSIVGAISTVFDPEIPVNIYELGLIYGIAVDAETRVGVKMTLTSPACPSAQQIPSEVRYKVKALDGVADCQVEIVWEPPWTKEMMSETAKLSLGIF